MSGSRVIRGGAGDWGEVEPSRYKDPEGASAGFRGVTRHTLLGAGPGGVTARPAGAEADPDDAEADPGGATARPAGTEAGLNFELRYFEIAPGGYSSLEHHAHGHAVVIVKGTGAVRLGEVTEPVSPLDVVYVAPHDVHRFLAGAGEALGFLCVVDRARDRPVAAEEDAPAASLGAGMAGPPGGRRPT